MSHPNSKTSVTIPQYILAPYVPTPPDVVERMLWLAQVTGDDLVYDLGCGDGRILIAAGRQLVNRESAIDSSTQYETWNTVISHSFKTADWNPSKSETFIDVSGIERTLHLWIVGESEN